MNPYHTLYSTFPAALPAAEAVPVAGSMRINTGQAFAVAVVGEAGKSHLLAAPGTKPRVLVRSR